MNAHLHPENIGELMETLGKAFTVIETGSERSVSPLLFVALAITAYCPAGTPVQINRYRSLRRGPVTVPISFVPWKNSTFAIGWFFWIQWMVP